MLYEKTEAAICDLLSTSAQTHGPIRIIFDLDTQAVSASFLSEEEAVKEFYLHPSEFFVDCTLHQADEIGVAIRAAAFNAVSGLADIVDIEQEKGDSPNLYGTMTLPGGEVVPYDEAVMSFVHEDCCINDPTLSECGRFAVDPSEQYGFDLAVRYGRQCLVRQLHNGELQLTGPMNQGLPEKGNPANTLTRLTADGEVLAYARIDQIRTSEDYPEDIASLTTRAQPREATDVVLRVRNANNMDEQTLENAVALIIHEGVYQSYRDQEMASLGDRQNLTSLHMGSTTIETKESEKLCTITFAHPPSMSESQLKTAVKQALEDGASRVKNIGDGGFAKGARMIEVSVEGLSQPLDLTPAYYKVYGIPEEATRDSVERAINAAINAGLEAAIEEQDLHGGIADGPAGDAMRLDIGSPFLFERDVRSGSGKLSIPTRVTGAPSDYDATEALDWVLQQGEMRVKQDDPASAEAKLLSSISLGIAPDREIELPQPDPGF